MRKILPAFLFLFFAATSNLYSQSCFNVSAGPDIFTSCTTTCMDIKVRVPDVKTSDDYKVVTIPYAPLPFTSPIGNELTLLYQDDKFSDPLDLPFPFCFYGNTYTQVSVGSNGVLTFDVAENAGTDESYVIDPGDKIFYSGGSSGDAGQFYAPRASIFLAYFDMDPRTGQSPANRKIEWRLEGSAPCRKMVVSFFNVAYYHEGGGSCINMNTTMQVVLYEGTGLIDVFYENKPACLSYQGGLAIAGLQNWKQDAAVTLPGKNGTVWEAAYEGYRYIPNGSGSLLNRVELYKNNVLIPVTPTIVDLGTGELEATFPNICQSEDSMSYVVKAFYKQCDNPVQETEGSDTIIVQKTLNPVDATATATTCATSADGKIVVNSPVAANIEYSIDGTNWQTATTFLSVPPATYTVTARIISSTCTGKTTVTISAPPPVIVSTNVTPPNCPGTITGTITVTAPTGSDIEYSIDGGTIWQASNVFTVGAGNYIIKTKTISTGCIGTSSPIPVTDPAPMTITKTTTAATCNGSATGKITITAPVGSDYEYSINGGSTWQASPIFTVPAATYTITVRQISINCTNTTTATITEPSGLSASATQTKPASCANNDGEITVTVTGGTTPYQFTINNGATYQSSNIFTGLDTATYNKLKVKDFNGCEFAINTVVVTLNDTMHLELGPDSTICFGQQVVLVPQTNPQTNIFTWTPTNGTLSSTSAGSPTATPLDTTKYFLTAQFGICKRSDDITINVLHKPIAYAGKDTTICANTPAFLKGTATILSGMSYYSWSPDAAITYTSPDSSRATARPDSAQEYAFIVKDGYGCNFVVSDTMEVFIQPAVPAFAGNDTIAMLNKPHQLHATGGVQYLWSPAGPLNNASSSDPVAVLRVDTYFKVLVTDAIGCTATDDIFIKVYEGPTFYLPNAFSPNGDGLNDIFRPIPSGIKSITYFRIFNRYGQIMFETNQYLKGWDGTFKGKPQLPDTYVWIIKGINTFGRTVEDKGTVTLIR
jgi:gliding motility-associated-like protein